jgi:type IV secretory pathway VirB6-like protein
MTGKVSSIMKYALIGIFLWCAYGAVSEAHAGPFAAAAGGMRSYCPEDGTLFARVITCLENTVIDATEVFLTTFYPEVRDVVFAALILAVILFGVLLALGAVERVAQDTVFFLLKFGGIIYFMDDVVNIYNEFVAMLFGTLNAISNASVYGGTLHCPSVATNVAATTPMWQRADCIFDMVVGLSANAAITSTAPQDGMARGMMAFFYYNLQSGALGILIGIVGIYICFNLLKALLQASYTYLIALLTLSLLFLVGALFVPLLIFKSTFGFFEKWLKMVLAMILQPLILFAYLNVLFVAFDIMLFSGTNSLMRTIAGGAVDAASFNIHDYAEANNLYSENFQGGTQDVDPSKFLSTLPGVNEGTLGNVKFTDQRPNYADRSQLSISLKYRVIDYTQIPGGAAALAGATLLVGLASYILLKFLEDIPGLARDLGGGSKETPNVIGGTDGLSLPMSSQMQQLGGAFSGGIKSQLSGLVGKRG